MGGNGGGGGDELAFQRFDCVAVNDYVRCYGGVSSLPHFS